jgi:phage-related protein
MKVSLKALPVSLARSGSTLGTRSLQPRRARPIRLPKPLKGFGGAAMLEIIASHHGNAWRAVYTVHFQDAIYVLHVFQKKSTKGTPMRDIDLIKQRLAEADAIIEKGRTKMKNKIKKGT